MQRQRVDCSFDGSCCSPAGDRRLSGRRTSRAYFRPAILRRSTRKSQLRHFARFYLLPGGNKDFLWSQRAMQPLGLITCRRTFPGTPQTGPKTRSCLPSRGTLAETPKLIRLGTQLDLIYQEVSIYNSQTTSTSVTWPVSNVSTEGSYRPERPMNRSCPLDRSDSSDYSDTPSRSERANNTT